MNLNKEFKDYLEELIKTLPKVDKNRKYWMIRSGEKSKHFNEFVNNSFVAIPWEKLNDLNLLKDKTSEEIKDVLIKKYDYKPQPLSTAANKINRFINEIKIGDVIVMPSARLQEVAIGIIRSEVYITDCLSQQNILEINGKVNKMNLGCYNKRRKISWVNFTSGIDIVDKSLINALYNIHGIVEISNKDIQDIVEGMLNPFYINKKGEASLTFNINSKEKIRDRDLNPITNEISNIIEFLSEAILELDDDIYTKHSFSSPGTLKYFGGPLILMGVALVLSQLTEGSKEIEITSKSVKVKVSSEKSIIQSLNEEYHKWRMNDLEYESAKHELNQKIKKSAEVIQLESPKIK